MFSTLFFLIVIVFLLYLLCGRGRRRTYPYEGLPIYDDFIKKTLNGQLLSDNDVEELPKPLKQVQQHQQGRESRGEATTREVMEDIFKVPFEREPRLDWLRNPLSGARLKLDGYNAELGIAFEYNGEQHYDEENTFPGTTKRKHGEQIYRDLKKHELCNENDVYLFTIPYWVKNKRAHIIDQMYPEMRAKYITKQS